MPWIFTDAAVEYLQKSSSATSRANDPINSKLMQHTSSAATFARWMFLLDLWLRHKHVSHKFQTHFQNHPTLQTMMKPKMKSEIQLTFNLCRRYHVEEHDVYPMLHKQQRTTCECE
jgi:hypothetical protein